MLHTNHIGQSVPRTHGKHGAPRTHHQRLSPTDTLQKPPPRLGPGKRQEGRQCKRKFGPQPHRQLPQLCVGKRRLIPQNGQKDLLRQLRPRYPLDRSPGQSDGHRSRVSGAFAFTAPPPPATRSAQRPQGLAKREARGPGGRSSQDSAASRRQQAARGSPRPSRGPDPHFSPR